MRRIHRSLSLRSCSVSLLAAIALVGCAKDDPALTPKAPIEPLSHIDVHPLIGDGAIHGVSRAGENGDLLDLIVPGRGIVRVDRHGALVSEHPIGQQGLEDRGYNDLASLPNDQFVLLSNAEGYLYDPATRALNVHFCVEPGWEEPIQVQRNDAVAAEGNLILAAPRFYLIDGMGAETLTESSLRTYRAADGTPLSSVDLTAEGLELMGIAQAGDEILGVQHNELVRFSLQGELLSRQLLEGVLSGSGIAVDLSGGTFIVSDAEQDVLRIFTL